ncbi:MAG: DUF4405 domain-containing protein [Bacteroidales bacterium]
MSWKYNRTKINFYIDIALLILLGGLAGIGLLIKYVLIPGQEAWLLFGDNVELTFWGLNRHEWGTIHLITGILFFIAFVLHIVFHWNMIKCMFRQCLPSKTVRGLVAIFSVVLFVLLIILPLFVKPVKEPVSKGAGRLSDEKLSVDINDSIQVELKKPRSYPESREPEIEYKKKEEQKDQEEKVLQEIDITGRMTLDEVAERYDYPVSKLKEELDIPDSVSETEKLGRLRKRYDFKLSDVKEIVTSEKTHTP